MLHEIFFTAFYSAADTDPSPSTTLSLTIVGGIVTIVVSLIGVWGVRSKAKAITPGAPTVTDIERLEAEIERLERICYEWGIDPRDGQPMRQRGGRHAET